MRLWPALGAASFVLLLMQCGGDAESDADAIPLPDRVDPDAGLEDAPADPTDRATSSACDPTKPFGTPVRLVEFDAATHRSVPRLSADELTIYFTTNSVTTGADLSMASRASKTSRFDGEKVLAPSSAAQDNDPSVSFDHLGLWFHSGRNGSADIFHVTRASTTVPFGAADAASLPVAPGAVNQSTSSEAHAYFREAGNELWFVSDRMGGAGGFDIYVAVGSGTTFASPTRVAELSSPLEDWQPQPSEDGLTVVLASSRAGGKGNLDLWIAHRPSTTALFAAPVPLAELNSPSAEEAGWISADGCRIWFSSGRETNDTNQQIFYAERPL